MISLKNYKNTIKLKHCLMNAAFKQNKLNWNNLLKINLFLKVINQIGIKYVAESHNWNSLEFIDDKCFCILSQR